ncbi:MAG TPA: TAXI family TRAP transporter solute-binding subunit [Anaeromyxobacteraceae bacterium]|nr:TAXI family TRAP transporter solute-binding subunit [Anaeromyxobacteraceae bacterium]
MAKRSRAFRLLIAAAVALALVVGAWSLLSEGIPPRTVTMATGPEGGDYAEFGKRYRALLAASGVDLRLAPTAGAVENLSRLRNPRSGVKVGFAMAGVSGAEASGLLSLGTIGYEPLWYFERTAGRGTAAEGIAGKRISIGPEGSGTRALALQILSLLGADRKGSGLLGLAPKEAAERLLRGEIDGFAMVASWDAPLVRELAASPHVSPTSLPRADAVVALNPHLTKVVLPSGVGDLPRDLPPKDVVLLASKSSLVIREDLHPAIQYLLLQAASKIHSGPGIFHRAGTFPAPEAIDIPLSEYAARYHTTGSPFLQRHLPFWLWVLAERLLVILVPLVGIAYPLIRIGPGVYQAVMQRRIVVLYGELKVLEMELENRPPGASAADLVPRLEALEARAGHLRVPLMYSQMLYTLKVHIQLVRDRLARRG